ncbi:putative serine/threonine-protein kinase [Platanthera guangdongensis]|uniref:Serine/threonine-protein kinase n=1 Tax=Platanthera guangdongensis TaxID=2320717 RepID=A0ABR2LI08_9ASPA
MFAEMLQRRWYAYSLCLHLLLLFLLPFPALSSESLATNPHYNACSKYSSCRIQQKFNVTYPFSLPQTPAYCGYPGYELICSGDNLAIRFGAEEYIVTFIDYNHRFLIVLSSDFMKNYCPLSFSNTSIDSTLFKYADLVKNLTVYLNCSFAKTPDLPEITCLTNNFINPSYYKMEKGPSSFLENLPGKCGLTAAVPVYPPPVENSTDMFEAALKEGFALTWNYDSEWCQGCIDSGGICGFNRTRPEDQTCFCPNITRLGTCNSSAHKRNKGLIIAGLSVAGGLGVALFCFLYFLLHAKWKRKRRSGSALFGRIVSFHPSSKSESELFSSLNAPIFKYEELYAATNGFDDSKELGDGGFGTVYKGKLQDGRVVAVKRLYENNYRRVEQFMNEVKILSLLRHQNLVSLYGCTSRHSRELLLVYEFVPNGTVADHLHGPLASKPPLPWHIRMSIAIETADALKYLHSIEPQIIHRDVKTNNILLDGSFHVKVADFGLSRLFPLDATHVSTAPQGTPGYVDPEYHRCYQLTEKSDVYSFGVVLMELISSKPAVDITRERNEINLASMAMNMIQRQELHEFVDQNLGYHSDCSISRMINQVAELGFQCLQSDGEMRPSIKVVLEILQEIEKGGRKKERLEEADSLKEEALLLKNSPQDSPNSVTVGWVSMGVTPNTSE